MTETIAINGLTLCHKNSSGLVMASIPDVCKAPTYPVPFPNIAFSRDLAKGTTTVKSHSGAMCGIKGSEFSVSTGDEPGVGGGVTSGVNRHKATFLMWSPNVFMQGKPVTRLTDKMLMNKGNTVSLGGYFTGIVTGANLVTLDILCAIACACIAAGAGNQRCVDLALRATLAAGPQPPQNGLFPEVTFEPNGTMYRDANGSPQTRYGVPGSRIDVVTVVANQPVEFVEMKFPGDRLRGTQRTRYEAIARANGSQLQLMNIPEDCNMCRDDRPEPEPEPVRVPVRVPEPATEIPWVPIVVTVGVLAFGACVLLTAGACGLAGLAAGGSAGLSTAAATTVVVGGVLVTQ